MDRLPKAAVSPGFILISSLATKAMLSAIVASTGFCGRLK